MQDNDTVSSIQQKKEMDTEKQKKIRNNLFLKNMNSINKTSEIK